MQFFKPPIPILPLLITLTLLGACTPAAENTGQTGQGGFSRYTDLAAGFAVDYPRGWKQWQDKKTGEFMFAASDEPGADHCWVFAERVSPAWLSGVEATLDSINTQLYLIKRHREAKNHRRVKDGRAPLSGYPARHFSLHFDAPLQEAPAGGPPRPSFPFKTEFTVTYAQARPFVLGCTGRRDVGDPAALERTIERMRTSFRPMR